MNLFLVGLFGNAFGVYKSIQLVSCHSGDVNPLQFLPVAIQKNNLRRFSRNLFEYCVLILGLKVLVDEFLHLGELVQSSSGARLDPGGEDGGVLAVGFILMKKKATIDSTIGLHKDL